MSDKATIIYTHTDEAPALATYSFLPIIAAYSKAANIQIETRDISLASRVLAVFPDYCSEDQKQPDDLEELGHLAKAPEANIIKLPNISASEPQLLACIKELHTKGYRLPEYPETSHNDEEKDIKARYDKVKGSAVNPILREGNSDRRAPNAVKKYARKNPHSMGEWSKDSSTHVASMTSHDFFDSELSLTLTKDDNFTIEFESNNGEHITLKESTSLVAGEVIDASVLSCRALIKFLEEEMQDAKNNNLLFSIHLKATMMKVSDPILFGHVVSIYFKDLFEKHVNTFKNIGVNPNNGFGSLLQKIQELPADIQDEIEEDIQACYEKRPALAMVDSEKGISNLHIPSDIIIDASMPAAIRVGGQMWNTYGQTQDMKAVIPDRCYAGVYQAVIAFCKENGAFDPRTMGSISNVGLMAQKAEEYGSHDKTFEIKTAGKVRVLDQSRKTMLEHKVERGDIWRMCQTKDAPIQDWVKLAVNRARATACPTIFWLDSNRAHDSHLIKKVNTYLLDHDTQNLDIRIMPPVEATRLSLERMKQNEDTISVTGNVLRDYLTDLFPILELGTSAKMLSIVPLMNGGGLFETGAGGSAPKHVQQLIKENHLRWDSLGEFLALSASYEHFSQSKGNHAAQILADTLDIATGRLLIENKSPSRKVGELDSRGSHFYLSLYWAQEITNQNEDANLKKMFAPLALALADNEEIIINELNSAQGQPIEIGGYYKPDYALCTQVMRPSVTLNKLIDQF
ncbi:MAG: NADP-dependent isocitrate dehydrogenase [Pseudohongiellaceae bacterium]